MPSDASSTTRVEKDRLLLVEGRDEVNLFDSLLREMAVNRAQVIDVGGQFSFRPGIEAVLADARVRDIGIKCLGIVRDAHQDGIGAFRSICSTLGQLGLPIPGSPQQMAPGSPGVAVLIVPEDTLAGSLEDVCWRSIQDLPAAACVESYIECLRQKRALDSVNLGKTRVHAFLASRQDPTTTVGLGALKGYWPLGSAAFAEVKRFIRLIADS